MNAMKRAPGVLFLVCGYLLAAAPLSAHRLDEYLQATFVEIARDRVDLEINLTPGVSIAPQVVASIDRDSNNAISADEADAYANAVMASISLQVDGRAREVALTGRRFPTTDEMREGVGTIHLKASARLPESSAGGHALLYRNMHRPELGVYLANALVPSDRTIEIAKQERDVLQHELRIDYRVAGNASQPWTAAASAGAATLVTLFFWRRRHARSLRSD
jgi:hypothetical protein